MHATIIGAGIAGLALARGLRAVGFDVEIFEQAPELKPIGAGIALTANGLRALVRRSLYPEWRERFAGYTCWRGIVQRRPDAVESGHTTESWGRGRRFGIVPLKGGQVYWFACTGSTVPGDRKFAGVGVPELRKLSRNSIHQCLQS
jgi:2-polyprenyl-6-methoxyphenol hydroxylase-like FAD-dependent oxidoreductase